jgi:uncharacterized protein GlcG (DUF336 family)
MSRLLLLTLAVTLAMAALPASEAEGDSVSFSMPSKVGSLIVPPGLYRLKLQGALVFLTEVNTKKSFSALVKVEKTAKKSGFTAAQGRSVDGTQHIESIVLAGADYKLVF